MPKRFIDTAIVKKEWFAELNNFEQAAWLYIICECDAVGVYELNRVIEKAVLGNKIDFDTLISKSHSNLEFITENKIFILNYPVIQYGESIKDLDTKSKPMLSHQRLLRKHGLLHRVIEISTTVHVSPKEKEKEKDKEKEKEKDAPKVKFDHRPVARMSNREFLGKKSEYLKSPVLDDRE